MMGNRTKRAAKLLTFTVLHAVPEDVDAPIILGMVELTDSTKLLCNGRCQEQELEIGQEVIINQKDDKYTFELKG